MFLAHSILVSPGSVACPKLKFPFRNLAPKSKEKKGVQR